MNPQNPAMVSSSAPMDFLSASEECVLAQLRELVAAARGCGGQIDPSNLEARLLDLGYLRRLGSKEPQNIAYSREKVLVSISGKNSVRDELVFSFYAAGEYGSTRD
jgi:hypothetical protein